MLLCSACISGKSMAGKWDVTAVSPLPALKSQYLTGAISQEQESRAGRKYVLLKINGGDVFITFTAKLHEPLHCCVWEQDRVGCQGPFPWDTASSAFVGSKPLGKKKVIFLKTEVIKLAWVLMLYCCKSGGCQMLWELYAPWQQQ